MSPSDDPVTILPVSECWSLLASVPLGRLVTVVDGQPEIFPVNFVVQDKTVLFATAGGTKLASTAMNNRVLFEADGYDAATGWSVIVRGATRSLRSHQEIEEAGRAGLPSWVGWLQPHYVRVLPTAVTGRRFRFSPQPAR